MAKENKKPEELKDEQLKEVAGGYIKPPGGDVQKPQIDEKDLVDASHVRPTPIVEPYSKKKPKSSTT